MRIGALARLAHVTPRTVRHYHQIGLLPEPERLANGYRDYSVLDVTALLRVRRLVALGLPLERVGDLVGSAAPGSVAAELAGIEQELRDQIALLTEQLLEVQQVRTSPLPEAAAAYAQLDSAADLGWSDPHARRVETDLSLLLAAAGHERQLMEYVEAVAADPARALHLARIGERLLQVTEATPEVERNQIAAELAQSIPVPQGPELSSSLAGLVADYAEQSFTPAQQDVLQRVEHHREG